MDPTCHVTSPDCFAVQSEASPVASASSALPPSFAIQMIILSFNAITSFYVRVNRFLWREAIHSFPPPTKVHRQVMTSYIRCIKQRVILLRRDMIRHIHFRCSTITWSRASNSFSSICRMLSIDEIYGHMAAELCFHHKVADVNKYILCYQESAIAAHEIFP